MDSLERLSAGDGIGSSIKTALVIGSSQDALAEAHHALTLFTPDATFLVNDMIPRWPFAQFFCSLHADQLKRWIEERNKAGLDSQGVEVWSHRNCSPSQRPYDVVQHVTVDWGGSSGLFAVNVARLKCYTKIVLAGVPMTVVGGHITRKKRWPPAIAFKYAWTSHKTELQLYVRSCSGWTQELFGPPTMEWLADAT